jgi:hypothetical protein
VTALELSRSVFASRTRGASTSQRHEATDLAFAGGLAVLALLPWMTTFDGPSFLAAGGIGAAIGLACAYLSLWLRRTWLLVPLLLVAYAAGVFIAARSGADEAAGRLPWLRLGITGWKQLLTTMPPVDGSASLVALPFLLGLVGSAAGYVIARSSAGPWQAAVPAVAIVVLTVVLGARDAWHPALSSLVIAAAIVVWASLRRRRHLRIVGTGAGVAQQGALAAALLVVAGLLGWVAGPHLPGVAPDRFVARNVIDPPFDVNQYASPLLAFRKFGRHAGLYYDRELMTVTGLPPDSRLRIAVLDYYSGSVWSAGSGVVDSGGVFQKVGRTIRTDGSASDVIETARVVLAPDAVTLPELAVWVPGVGPWTSVHFEGPRAALLRESLRYNTVTGQGLVPARLQPGDVVTVTGAAVRDIPRDGIQPAGTPPVSAESVAFVSDAVDSFVGETGGTPWQQLQAVAKVLQSGAYDDGTTANRALWPGHGKGRISDLLAGGDRMVGSDEQYAAAYALMANEMQVPARVVLGALVPKDGRVTGASMRAWVELQADSGEWFAVPNKLFMPDFGRTPADLPEQPATPPSRDAIPPAPAKGAPGSIDSLSEVDPAALRASGRTGGSTPGGSGAGDWFSVPAWVTAGSRILGPPLGGLAALAGVGAGARGLRRWRRRSTGAPSRRLAAGWRDLTDHARDLGTSVDARLPRREQAQLVGHAPLAVWANRAVFAPGVPTSAEIERYWGELRGARRQLSRSAPWHRRLLRPLSPRSFLVREPAIVVADEAPVSRRVATPRRRT